MEPTKVTVNGYVRCSWGASRRERDRVAQAVRRAVKSGRLLRPSTCTKCDKTARVEGHHHLGYEYPLDVTWLCSRCHVAAHWPHRAPFNEEVTFEDYRHRPSPLTAFLRRPEIN